MVDLTTIFCEINNFCRFFEKEIKMKLLPNKLFKGIAKKDKISVGWFYVFKLHFVINGQGEIIDYIITSGNIADNNKEVIDKITNDLFGKLISDKGYIGCFNLLFEKDIFLIHKLKSNMKNKFMLFEDKMILKRYDAIESTIKILKNIFNRSRSRANFLSNIFSALIVYAFNPLNQIFYD